MAKERAGGVAAETSQADLFVPATWHYGLVARWWAETNAATPEEIAYYVGAVRRHGEPVLDVGCGSGRLLLPLLAEGFDVDGTDVSPDMLTHAAAGARALGRTPLLEVVPSCDLALERRYRTILMSGVFGIGATRADDTETLRRLYRHLQPGGVLLLEQWLPYADQDELSWARWLPGHRSGIPREWPGEGERRTLRDGDELELMTRLARLEPLAQRRTLEIRARLWRGGTLLGEEAAVLTENLYFGQELVSLVASAGFSPITIEGAIAGHPADDDDARVIIVAHRGSTPTA
jgi:SAM-dependent methyltransferase